MYRLFCFLLILNLATCVDYCELDCNGKEHTVCTRGHSCGIDTSSCASGAKEIKLTKELRDKIVERHNHWRNRVALGKENVGVLNGMQVADMMAFSYDADLEYTARCWANVCTFKHDKCRGTERYRHAGQNLYYQSGGGYSDALFEKAIDMWYDEVKWFTHDLLQSFHPSKNNEPNNPSAQVGHATQMLWADTMHVGCAAVDYKEIIIACNYGPGGNILNNPVFTKGKPCSQCGDYGCNKKFKGLCGEVEESPSEVSNGSNLRVFILLQITVSLAAVYFI